MTTDNNKEQPDTRSFTIPFTISITYQQVKDLLCSALEGYSDYWIESISFKYPKGKTRRNYNHEFRHLDLPFEEGCSVLIYYTETNDGSGTIFSKPLNLQTIESGLHIMADKYYSHFSNFLSGNYDAVTSDVYLQCCLFGELVYS